MREAVLVANTDGMDFIAEEVLGHVMDTALKTGANNSSMLQDIQNKRPTEIQRINGAVVKRAKALGVETPYNDALVNLISAKESNY